MFSSLTDEINETVDRLSQDCDRALAITAAEEAIRTHEDRKRAKAEEKSKSGLLFQRKHSPSKFAYTIYMAEKLKDGIIDWINAGDDLDVRGDLQLHSTRRHGETCAWLFETEQFQRWRDDTSENVLWYNASPGSGKSVLSSTVIKHLVDRGLPTAYFFYSFSDFTKRQASSGPRALALQLLHILKTGIPDKVVELYQDEMAQHAKYLRMESLVNEVLCQLLKGCSLVYLVVDGLDECLEDEQMRDMLTTIVSAPVYGTVKWFFTSRSDVHIRRMMEQLKATTMSPSAATLSTEIRLFLTDGLQPIEQAANHVDAYVEHSEGSFLYSKFLLDALRGEGITCDDDLRKALHEFPKSLTDYYLRSLLTLCKRHEREQELVQ